MSSEENYLDDLLNHVLEPKPAEPMNEVQVAETNAEQDIQDDLRISDIEELEPEASEQNSEITELEMPELEDIELEALNIEENGADALQISDIEPEMPEPNELETPEPEAIQPEIPELEELEATQPEIPELEELEATQPNTPDLEDLEEPHTELSEQDDPLDIEIPDIDTDKELSLEDNKMPEDDELKLEDIELSELEAEMPLAESELNIDGLDEAIQSETELEMAGELNIDELDFGDETAKEDHFDVEIPDPEMPDIPDSEDFDMSMENASAFPELSDAAELLKENAKANEGEASATMEDNLEDVLNMLDDDAELAEINDMLKKSDNNEPIQDDMMDLLHQMADDEAASVNAGIKHVDDEDDGVPLPELPQSVLNAEQTDQAAPAAVTAEDDSKKKGKKVSVRKAKGGDGAAEGDEPKKPGVFGKFFNLLTEDLVPEPTEEELAAEKEAKAAKKQEQKAKKKEKQAEKEKKAAAKRAKLEAEGPKKRIPPKKIAVGAVFGATVGGAVIIATNTLATQGFLQSARNAYIAEDYKTVYQLMYDMDLDENSSEGRIKAKSEILLKMQRRYDSYQTNMKMGREVEALDALLQGITTYDQVNADAEKYEVMEEVDAIKAEILEILQTNYHLDETGARELIRNEDALSYTIALNDVINGN